MRHPPPAKGETARRKLYISWFLATYRTKGVRCTLVAMVVSAVTKTTISLKVSRYERSFVSHKIPSFPWIALRVAHHFFLLVNVPLWLSEIFSSCSSHNIGLKNSLNKHSPILDNLACNPEFESAMESALFTDLWNSWKLGNGIPQASAWVNACDAVAGTLSLCCLTNQAQNNVHKAFFNFVVAGSWAIFAVHTMPHEFHLMSKQSS